MSSKFGGLLLVFADHVEDILFTVNFLIVEVERGVR
jgi:hypothetical protein